MRTLALVLCASALILGPASALYSSRDDVVEVTDSSFAKEVTKDAGVVAVEFYAP